MDSTTVKARREALGWSQEKLAREALVTTRTIANIEANRHRPQESTLRVIEDALRRGEVLAEGNKR